MCLAQVLSENISYIVTTLGLEGVDLALSSDLGEKGEDCRPGAPIIAFRTEPSVTLQLTNNQPFTGLFNTACPILQGDTVKNITRRLARMERNIKGIDLKCLMLNLFKTPIFQKEHQ